MDGAHPRLRAWIPPSWPRRQGLSAFWAGERGPRRSHGGPGRFRAASGLTAARRGRTPAAARPRAALRYILRASAWGGVCWPQPRGAIEDAAEQLSRHRDFGHLEDEVAAVRDHLRPDLHHLLAQARQRPLRDLARQRQGTEEVGEVVRQHVELEPDGVRAEGRARQPRPLDRVLPFLDPLFGGPAPVAPGLRHRASLAGTLRRTDGGRRVFATRHAGRTRAPLASGRPDAAER